MTRLVPLDMDSLTTEQSEVAAAIMAGPRGGLRGPFEAWLRSPQLADRAQKLGEYCRFGSSLPKDLSELAIILAGKHWKSQYEFWAHARLAKEAGLAEEVIEAVRSGSAPPFTKDSERVVYDFVTEYFATNRVSDTTYARAIKHFGEESVVDLVGVVGYYAMIAMLMNVARTAPPQDGILPLGALPQYVKPVA